MLKFQTNLSKTKLLTYEQNPFFLAIITYLANHRDSLITLRDIKREFPELVAVETFIEPLIESGLIERHQGTYRLGIAYYSTKDIEQQVIQVEQVFEEYNELINNWLNHLSIDIPVSQQHSAILESVFMTFLQVQQSSFYEDNLIIDRWRLYPIKRQCLEEELFNWIFYTPYYQEASNQYNLYDYFKFLTLNDTEFPNSLLDTYRKIGDVNPHFFFHHVERKLKRILKGRTKTSSQRDVLMETLIDFDYLSLSDGHYQPQFLFIEDTAKFVLPTEVKNALDDVIMPQMIDEKAFIISSCLLDWLIQRSWLISPVTSLPILVKA
ncbi:hypothetical protein CBF34_07535 [Vagococcus penaei]|uniref:Uncharacterized protein n=1 Tax=Vagococcus penaei TaxID=633807 RepID=A0A1Q2D391_9ENTE|nr:DUF1803 domain-containing protein [Vagococcus penaei]AQP52829.1 hypothetical protein BW732_00400 [Vagococcus penaei]RSU01170.1 hypothetical protein CBF34_07535 [Vagococcus penaei]